MAGVFRWEVRPCGYSLPVDALLLTEIGIILLLVLFNGVLAGSEIAVVSLRKTRLKELAASGSSAARAVLKLRDDPETFLATVQIGITIVGTTAGAFGGAAFAKDLEPLLLRVPGLSRFAPEIALVLVVSVVTYLSVVLGELIPKSLALRYAERYALLIGRPLLWLSRAARPLVWLLTASSNVVLRPFKDRTNFLEARISPDEIQQLVDEASKSGALDPRAGEIASRALDFASLTAQDVMVPRNEVVAVDRRATPDQLRQALLEEGHTRFPVYDGTIDAVCGYLSMKEVLALGWERELLIVEDLLRPAYFVPATKRAIDVLNEMRDRRVPFAVVVDERGGTAGIITLDDLLEELVGEILTERAKRAEPPIVREPGGSAQIHAALPVRVVNRTLGFALSEEGGWTTVAGLVLALLGKIPVAGDCLITANGYRLEIIEASPRGIRKVRILPP